MVDGDNGMKQRVRIRVEICFAPNPYARACALYICWGGELDVGCIAGSFLARLIYAWRAGLLNKISTRAIHCKSCWIELSSMKS